MKLIKNKKNIKLFIIIILVLIIIFAIFWGAQILKYKKYKEYGIKIKNYGFEELYNNSSVSSYQKLSKLEAVKLVIASTLNTTDINSFEKTEETEDQNWISFALRKGVITNAEKDQMNKKASYIDVIRYISNAKYNILNLQYDVNETPKFKDLDKYSQDEQINISDLVSNSILTNSSNKLEGNKPVSKGVVNKLIVKYYEKFIVAKDYGTVRDENNDKPNNSDKYPYLLNEVENIVYEEKFSQDTTGEVIEPTEYYEEMNEYYKTIKEQCEAYYSVILNVNYATIDEKEFKDAIQKTTIDILDDYSVSKYVKYVKENKIILSGKATVQMPIVYNDGFYCRVRTKIELNIESSETTENILFLDLNSGKNNIYNGKNLVFYVDSLLSSTLSSNKPYMKVKFIKDIILDISKDVINIESIIKEAE